MTGHFGDEPLQATDCTDTDDHTQETIKRKYTNKKPMGYKAQLAAQLYKQDDLSTQ